MKSRKQLIQMLEANDHNGCYSDADCLAEFGQVASHAELLSNAADQGLIERKQFDQDALIYCAGLSDDDIRAAAIKFRNPAKGIHIGYLNRDSEGNHKIHIIAPDAKVWNEIKSKFLKLGV